MNSNNEASFENEFEKDCVRRYEKNLEQGVRGYFDIEELECIIDHYADIDQLELALEATLFGLKIHPQAGQLKIREAKLLDKKREFKQVLAILKDMVIEDYSYYGLKGDALANLGQYDESIVEFNQFIDNCDPEERADLCYEVSLTFSNLNQFKIAKNYIELGLQINPDNLELLQGYASILEHLGLIKKAIVLYNHILNKDPYRFATWFMLGSLYYNEDEFQKAHNAFDYALAITPTDHFAILHMAHCLFNLERYKEAITYYKKYLINYDKDYCVWGFLAECYENLGHFDKAIISFNKSLEIEPDNFDSLVGIAICYSSTTQFDLALSYLQKADSISPNNAEILAYKGDVYNAMNSKTSLNTYLDTALDYYNEAYNLDNTQKHILVEIGHIYFKLQRYQVALTYYIQALNSGENFKHLPFLLAAVYFQLQNYKEMNKFLDLANQTDPESTDKFLNLYPNALPYIL